MATTAAALTGAIAGAVAGVAATVAFTARTKSGSAKAVVNRLHHLPGLAKPMASYSQVAEVNVPSGGAPRLLYLAGQTGHDESGKLASGGAGPQTEQCFANLATSLKGMGMTMEDLVKINVYLTSADDLSAYRDAHIRALGEIQPASTLVIVKALAGPEMVVEIEAVAAGV